MKVAARIDLMRQIEALHIGLSDRGERNRACVVDNNVDRAEAPRGLIDRALLVTHVDNHRQGMAASLFDCLRRRMDRPFELGMWGAGAGLLSRGAGFHEKRHSVIRITDGTDALFLI
jgi:hypothetical protein